MAPLANFQASKQYVAQDRLRNI